MTTKHLILGKGEVGEAVQQVVGGQFHDPYKNVLFEGTCQVLHVCFPYFEGFIKAVLDYSLHFNPIVTIIHSSVPVGTSEMCNAVHSPIRGVHPNLAKGIKTFVKYFGGEKAELASRYFEAVGVKTKLCDSSKTTEALKLWDTTQYGMMIMLNKEIHKYCEDTGLDFDMIYTDANQTYNEGYTKLGMSHVVRPFLKYMEGPIGGHCVIPNLPLLDKNNKSDIVKLINKGKTPTDV